MSTINLRNVLGRALTFQEGDDNFTNLNNDKLEAVSEDTAPSLGGTLSSNGNYILQDTNGNIIQGATDINVGIESFGSGILSITTDTGKLSLTSGTNDIELATGSGNITFTQNTTLLGAQNSVLALQTQGNGDLNISSSGSGDVNITLGGSGGSLTLDYSTWPNAEGSNGQVLTTDGLGTLSWTTVSGGSSGTTTGSITDIDDVRNPNTLTLSDTTDVQAGQEIVFEGTDCPSVGVTAGDSYYIAADIGGGAYEISTDSGLSNIISLTDIGTITDFTYTVYTTARYNSLSSLDDTNIFTPADGELLVYNSTGGQWDNTSTLNGTELQGYRETVYDLGTNSGTISPDIANGNVQKIILNGNITIDGFTNPVTGQSVKIIIDNGTGGYTLNTNSMMFSNSGDLALTGTSNSIDILTILYDGTNYYASLGKDFY